ncbi:MAG TPA: peptidylprolyl isomerase [Coleofasciculaceae cyanobacterium]|jgi:hypothetical protein
MPTDSVQAVSQTLQQVFADSKVFSLLKDYQLLPQLLQEMITDQAIAAFDCTSAEEATMRQSFFAQHQVSTAVEQQQWLDQRRLTLEEVMAPLRRRIRIEKFKQATWGHQVESYFLKQKDQLDRVVYSMIQHSDHDVITELYFRLQEQEQSFSELAPLYCQGIAAKTKGILGPVEFGQLPPDLAKLLHQGQPQQLLKTRIGGWHIVAQVEALIPARLDEATQQRLLNELFNQWLQQEVNQMQQVA